MNHGIINPDRKKVDLAVAALIKAIGYPEWQLDSIQILSNGIIRVSTRDHAMRGVQFTELLREAPEAVEVKK